MFLAINKRHSTCHCDPERSEGEAIFRSDKPSRTMGLQTSLGSEGLLRPPQRRSPRNDSHPRRHCDPECSEGGSNPSAPSAQEITSAPVRGPEPVEGLAMTPLLRDGSVAPPSAHVKRGAAICPFALQTRKTFSSRKVLRLLFGCVFAREPFLFRPSSFVISRSALCTPHSSSVLRLH